MTLQQSQLAAPPQSTIHNDHQFTVFVFRANFSPRIFENCPEFRNFEIQPVNSLQEITGSFRQVPGCLLAGVERDLRGQMEAINRSCRLMPTVLVTSSPTYDFAVRAAKLGAYGIIYNAREIDSIRNTIRRACLADVTGENNPFTMRCRISTLTAKERQVIHKSLQGKTTKSIAAELSVCHQTIDKHKKRALQKLKASSVVDLMNMLEESRNLTINRNSEILA